METNRLKQFCVIVETGSLIKASQLLHITHSAISKSMKHLQAEIGVSLLRPSGRGITPTEHGLEIYQRAKDFLEQENRLFKLNKNTAPSAIKIGAVEIFLLCMGEQFKQHSFENKLITLLDLDPGNMEQMIANRQLDYGITYAPFPMEQVEIIEIGKYRLGCYYLKNRFEGHPISEIPFVVPSQTLPINPLGIKERDGWIDSLYPRNKKFSVNLLSTAIELTLQ
ncbi:MAG: LysR family transcriptional regulator [Gammaproteobacteria bacterium]